MKIELRAKLNSAYNRGLLDKGDAPSWFSKEEVECFRYGQEENKEAHRKFLKEIK